MNAPSKISPSTFDALWQLGYRRLVPVIPHTAPISERSSLFKRVGTDQDSRGKAVGIKGQDGRWFGFDWLPHESDERDCARWGKMGAGIGVKTGRGLLAIDADTLNLEHASLIQMTAVKHFGVTPCRIGNHPKALYLIRVSAPIKYMRCEFGELDAKGRLKDRVEILSDGRQFVAHGIHPKTNAPYSWPFALVPFDQLPVFAPAQVVAFLEELRSMLPAAKPLIVEGATTDIAQASLRGSLDAVRKAVAATPNTSAAFGTREAYRDYGYAIRAALPDDEPAAFEIFSEWCARWTDGTNDPDIVAADWRRMKPPFRRGAGWLFELAEQHAPEQFKKVDAFFDEIPEPQDSLFPAEPLRIPAVIAPTLQPTLYSCPDPTRIPVREWLYGDHYIRGFVSATVAPGGVGKSSLTIVEALAMATGKPLLGVQPKGQFRVWLWNGEDPRDELNRRIAAAMMYYGLSAADIGDRLLVDTGHEQEIILAMETRTGATIAEGVSTAIVSALQRSSIDAFVIDPFVSSHRVNENDNGAIDLVVKRWGKIAAAASVAVEVVHHVRKTNGAEVTVEDARGASALVSGARSNRALTRMTDKDGRTLGIEAHWRYFRLGGVTKTNMAPATASPVAMADWFTLRSERLGNGPGEGLDALMNGDAVGVVVKAIAEDMTEPQAADQATEALRLIADGDGDWRADVRAGDTWVGYAVARAYGLDATDKADRTQINGILKRLRHEGRIFDEKRKDQSRHVREFVRVTKSQTNAPVDKVQGVFA
jgi:hypothetical protein